MENEGFRQKKSSATPTDKLAFQKRSITYHSPAFVGIFIFFENTKLKILIEYSFKNLVFFE